MSATETAVAAGLTQSDTELVAAVRTGDDHAFEELYRRYQHRISSFVRRVVRDEARAEDVTQEAFVSALRRMRATDSEIIFKPWIYEIARNAAIDQWRRSSRAEEVSISQYDLLRPADRARLVGAGAPEATLFQKERIDHLRWAMDELSQTHHRILVMRELEGLSYREIGERLELSRPAVESTLFRARRRLEHEYEEIEAGRRCQAIEKAIARISEGLQSETDLRRLSRHARSCAACRRRARQMGVEPLRGRRAAQRAAALLPLPGFLRRRFSSSTAGTAAGPDAGVLTTVVAPSAHVGAAVAERAAALVAAVAIAGAGGAVLGSVHRPNSASSAGSHHRAAGAGKHAAEDPGARRAAGERTGRLQSPRRQQSRARPTPHRSAADRGRPRERAPAGDLSGGATLPPIQAPAPPDVPKPPPVEVTGPKPPKAPEPPEPPSVDAPAVPLGVPDAPAEVPETGSDASIGLGVGVI
jgi:RNA polymerase sigma factor (sigma-70 family)